MTWRGQIISNVHNTGEHRRKSTLNWRLLLRGGVVVLPPMRPTSFLSKGAPKPAQSSWIRPVGLKAVKSIMSIILIVEDETLIRDYLGEFLEYAGYQVVVAAVESGGRPMPWTANDAEKHTHKATTTELKELWARIANERLEKTGDEGRAIREANSVIARQEGAR